MLFSAKGCIWKYNSDLDDDDKECSIFNGEDLLILRFSNTKSSMLYTLVSVGKADWIRVVSHHNLFTGSLDGSIGNLPAPAGWYIRYGMYGIFCTVRFGGSFIL